MENDLQQQSWKYFELHAHQRLTIFNFYIALCSAITAGLAATYTKDFHYPVVRVLFCILLILFSVLFWKLDERTKLLIKNGEAALKFYEQQNDEEIRVTHVFRREEMLTKEEKIRRWHPSYSTCFSLIFLMFGLLGVAALGWQAYSLFLS